jgi:hypothetical protein
MPIKIAPAFIAMGSRDADGGNAGLGERQNNVARSDFPHRLIERVDPAIGLSFRGPQVAARYLVPVGLILVDPPISHRDSQGLFATTFPSSTI